MVRLVIGVFAALFCLERLFPLRRRRAPMAERLPVNGAMTVLAAAATALIVQPVVRGVLGWTAQRRTRGSPEARGPVLLRAAAQFLLMDLAFYYWHRANHRCQLLWRFHGVHHIDPDLDVSTGFRFHPGEIALSAGFRAAQLGLIAPSPRVFALYELVFQMVTLYEHSNLRQPRELERRLARFLLTPRMHGIHHSQASEERDSNYSTVFPWWDWLHGTLRSDIPQERVVIGVKGFSPDDNRLAKLLRLPFEDAMAITAARGAWISEKAERD